METVTVTDYTGRHQTSLTDSATDHKACALFIQIIISPGLN